MVELLTDYTTQIYHALSTDARPDANPGDQLREIDTGKRFIFDGSTWLELPEGGGGGGGDPVYGLLTEINITEPISLIQYTIPPLALDAGRLWVEFRDMVLSATDYLYGCVTSPDGSATNGGSYLPQATTISQGYITHCFSETKTFNGHQYQGVTTTYTDGSNKSGIYHSAGLVPSVYKCSTYSNNTIESGVIRIYGRIG